MLPPSAKEITSAVTLARSLIREIEGNPLKPTKAEEKLLLLARALVALHDAPGKFK